VSDLAASLATGLVRNMPFVDGNKRTAYVCYRTFLARNCVALEAPDSEKFLQMIGLAAGTVSEEEFAGWLRRQIRDSVAIHITC
jgi:death-on-curing protein